MYNDASHDELAIEPSLGKRRRSNTERSPAPDVEGLKHEVKRLRAENASKEDRLRTMEAAEAMRETQLRQLQQAVHDLQQSQHGGYGALGAQDEQLQQPQHDGYSDLGGQAEQMQRPQHDGYGALGGQDEQMQQVAQAVQDQAGQV